MKYSNFVKRMNNVLTSMKKRSKNDLNVENAYKRAKHDLKVFYKQDVSKVSTKGLSEKQKKQLMKIGERITGSAYATTKSTQQLYNRQAQTFAQTYDISIKSAKQFQDLLKNDKQFLDSWERVKTDVKYIADRENPNQNNAMKNILKQKNGVKKFGQLVEIYTKTQSDYESFMDFLNDENIKELSNWELKDIELVKDNL